MTAVHDRARFEGDDLDEYLDLDDEDALDAYRELDPRTGAGRGVLSLFDDDDDDDDDDLDEGILDEVDDADRADAARRDDDYGWEDDLDRD